LVARDLVPIRASNGYDTTEMVLVTDNGGKANTVFRISGATVGATGLDLKGSLTFDLPIATGAVISAAQDTGNNYYLASESFLWKVDSGFATATLMKGSNLVGIPVTGNGGLIFHGGKLYVGTISNSTSGGGIYSTDPSLATWTFTALATDVKTGTNPVSFGQFLHNDVNGSLWIATGATVGQEGTGYMELSGTTLSQTPNTDSNNYTSSAIKTFNIGTLFRGKAAGPYFLGTVAHGLWTWDSTKKIWSQQ